MGSGIAEVVARSGRRVIAREVDQELLDQGLERVRHSLQRAAEKGKLSPQERDASLERIEGTLRLEEMQTADLVIEAVTENVELKCGVFADLDRIASPHAILASNTSSISITALAAATRRPDKVIGLHFFNPVPVMALLEIVRGLQTSDQTFELACELGRALGKTVVVSNDDPGFIVNRLFIPYGLDAVRALESGVAAKEDIDTAMRLGMNHPMGPFELMDFVGLDTMLFVADAMHAEFRDARYAAPPLLRRMVRAGWLGRKTGRGFYRYD
jgi:3-hydroxybutyryl-CoA dehydrogenase